MNSIIGQGNVQNVSEERLLLNDTVLLWDLKILYNFKVNFTSAMA